MIIDYSVKSPNLDNIYYGLGFITTWNTRQVIGGVLLGRAVALDVQVGGSVSLDSQVGTAVSVDKTDE